MAWDEEFPNPITSHDLESGLDKTASFNLIGLPRTWWPIGSLSALTFKPAYFPE
jgi:hypothetical protein